MRRFPERVGAWAIASGRHGGWVWPTTIAGTLVIAWGIAMLRGQPTDAARHLFYVPVIVSAVRYHTRGALLTAAAASLLAGPATLTAAGIPGHHWSTWTVRGAFLLLAGLVVAALVHQLQTVHDAHQQAQRTEHELRMVLIQTLSHELRTPVTVLRGALQTATDDRVDPATRQRLLDSANRAVDRLHGITTAVTACAGGTHDTHPEWIDLYALVWEICDTLRDHDAPTRVTCEFNEQTVALEGTTACRFALTELITNALKHTPADTPVHVHGHLDGDTLQIAVHDRGPGIPDHQLPHAGQPFRQLDGTTTRTADGLGLGLFATRKLAQAHRGTLHLANHPTGGLTATLRLPTTPEVTGALTPTTIHA